MKIAIFGSSGFVGLVLTKAALERGHEVNTLVRDPNKLGDQKDKVNIIQGDYFDNDKVKQTLAGCDVVLSTIGPPMKGADKSLIGKYEQAMKDLINAMNDIGLKRIITIGGAGMILPGEQAQLSRRIMRRILFLMAGKIYGDKENEGITLSQSNLDWTVVRPPMIAENVNGSLVADPDKLVGNKVDVKQLADFVLDNIESNDWTGKAPLVATK